MSSQPALTVHAVLPAPGPRAADAVAGAVDAHLRALRLDGRADVTVAAGPSWALRVGGRAVRCPAAEEAAVVHAATRGRTDRVADVLPEEEAAAVAGLCAATLQTRLSVLLGPGQPAGAAARAGLSSVLAAVVDHGVAVDEAGLAAVAGEALTPVEAAEQLIDRGQAAALDILLAPATLRRLTSGADPEVFTAMRADLYKELGALGPDFHLAADPSMPEDAYAFTTGAVRTWPRLLPPGGTLADVAASLAELLRRRAAWFVSVRTVEETNERLAVVLPDTMRTVRERYPVRWLTAVARAALDEGTSLRNLATVVDRLLDLDPHPSADAYRLHEGGSPAVGDLPSPRDTVALVRQRLREEIARTAPLAEVPVRRLGRPLEERLDAVVRAGTASEQDAEAAAAEVRTVAADGLPLVAPSLPLRGWLREELRGEFPDLEVVALTEYPPAVPLRVVRD